MNYPIITYVRFPDSLREQLEQIAKDEGESLATIIRKAAKEFVAARAKPETPAPKGKRTTTPKYNTPRTAEQ